MINVQDRITLSAVSATVARDMSDTARMHRKLCLFPSRTGGKEQEWQLDVFHGVSLFLGENERVGILGTDRFALEVLSRIISGVVTPVSGKVNRTVQVVSLGDVAMAFKPKLTLEENIRFVATIMRIPNSGQSDYAESKMRNCGIDRARGREICANFLRQEMRLVGIDMGLDATDAVLVVNSATLRLVRDTPIMHRFNDRLLSSTALIFSNNIEDLVFFASKGYVLSQRRWLGPMEIIEAIDVLQGESIQEPTSDPFLNDTTSGDLDVDPDGINEDPSIDGVPSIFSRDSAYSDAPQLVRRLIDGNEFPLTSGYFVCKHSQKLEISLTFKNAKAGVCAVVEISLHYLSLTTMVYAYTDINSLASNEFKIDLSISLLPTVSSGLYGLSVRFLSRDGTDLRQKPLKLLILSVEGESSQTQIDDVIVVGRCDT